MRARILASALAAGVLLACGETAADFSRADRGAASTNSVPAVLFIGNSLTGTAPAPANLSLPQVLAQLAAGRGRSLDYKVAYDFSHTLLESWQANIPEPALTGATQYDFISVQEKSSVPVQNPAELYSTVVDTYQPSLQRALKPATGRVIVFENWAVTDISPFPTRAAYAAALDANYATLMSKLGEPAVLAPLSRAWEQVLSQQPQSYLFADDRHPNGAGVYLNACVYYAIIFQDSPLGLPDLYLSAADAALLQQVAAQIAPLDTGASDAGLSPDAGAPDAGMPDASPPDSGNADSGIADSGIADSGIADSGIADSGIADSGIADAGNGDAGASPDGGTADDGSATVTRVAAASAASGGGCTSAGGARSWLWLLGAAACVLRLTFRSRR